MIDTVSEPMS